MAKSAALVNRSSVRKSTLAKLRPRTESAERYGYILGGRALAEAAARLRAAQAPTSGLVLMVLYSYMGSRAGSDLSCRVSRATIADVLGMTRQAVQKHLGILKDAGILQFESINGETTTFTFAPALLDPLRTSKPRAEAIEAGRAQRRAERKESRKAAERPRKPASGRKRPAAPKNVAAANGRERPATAPPRASQKRHAALDLTDVGLRLCGKYGSHAAHRIMQAAQDYADEAGCSPSFLLTRFGIEDHLAHAERWRTSELAELASTIRDEIASGKLSAAMVRK